MKAHFILYVRDQSESTQYYSAVFAVEPTLYVPGMTEIPIGSDTVLGLMPQDGVKRLFGENVDSIDNLEIAPRAELYLLADDPDACHARAVAEGGREISPMQERDWGHFAAYSIDPDGYVLAFANQIG